MKTQIFAKTESELLPYLPAYKAIMSATGFMGVEVFKNTGVMQEVIKPFSAEQKLVWLYALDRYRFFSKENKEWFDNQIEIAEACNVSESCVKKFFRSLREANVIKSKGTRIGGHNSNSYIILKDLVLVQADKTAQKPSVSSQVERSEQVDTQVAPTPKQPLKGVENVAEEEDDSFESLLESAADDYRSYQAPVEQKTVCPFATAPAIAFNVRGEATEEMIAWCDKNGVSIRGLDGRTVFKLKGTNYTKTKEGYKEYTPVPYKSSAPKTLAEDCGMEHMLNQFCNDEIDVPF